MDEENNVQQIIDTLCEEAIDEGTSGEQRKANIAQICALSKVQNDQIRTNQEYWRFEDEMKLKRESLELEREKFNHEVKNRKKRDLLEVVMWSVGIGLGLLEIYDNRERFYNMLEFSKDNFVTAKDSWKFFHFKKR